MNNKQIQKQFELENELENWLTKFDPQDHIKIVWDHVLDCCRMPLGQEFDMRLRLDDRFNKGASLC